MRISTNSIYQNGINQIGSLQSDQAKLQQQISAQKRILSPSDDPVGAARVLGLQQSLSVNTQFTDNRKVAETQLSTLETSLGSITDLLISTKSELVSAGNASMSDTERGYMATDLRGRLEQLIGLANTKDGSGNYLYSGYATTTAPFTQTATGATYQGDDGRLALQVGDQRQMTVGETGKNLFQPGTQDIFAALNSLATLLETPVVTAADRAALTAGLQASDSALESTLDNVLTSRAAVGSKLNELDALNDSGSSRDLQLQGDISDLQDLDMAKALSDMSKQQLILEAAQKSFVATTGLSLFKYL